MFKRTVFQDLLTRLKEPRKYLQVLAGPRQVGKTTLINQVSEALKTPSHYASADDPTLQDLHWIEQQWHIGRLHAKDNTEFLLILDEIQKIPRWSDIVKKLWDQDTQKRTPIKVVLLGSSPLLIQRGLTESLAGRFEITPITHWSYNEMRKAFKWNWQQYIYYGGYPGCAHLINDPDRWRQYIVDSLIETTISRDILLMNPVNKPALLRRLFYLGSQYSSQILSYQKMTGQLQDAGNTTTLAHYLELLSGAGMLTGISKFAGQIVRQRGTSPKLQVMNTALMSAFLPLDLEEIQLQPEAWGRLIESAIGAHLINSTIGSKYKVFYWREKNQEVDFILQNGKKLIALEVKSGRAKDNLAGLAAFKKAFNPQQSYLIGEQGMAIDEFLSMDIRKLFE